MSEFDNGVAVADPVDELFHFEATDVTGHFQVHVTDIERGVRVATVAKALAARMSLPEAIPYTMFDSRGAILADDQPIAEQIKPGENVTLAPKTHLG